MVRNDVISLVRYLVLFVLVLNVARIGVAIDEPVGTNKLQGKWWILGNVTRGSLEIEVDQERRLSGSIYGQPIRGSLSEDQVNFQFDRFRDEKTTIPYQRWNGRIVEVDCNDRKVDVIEGTFCTLDAKGEITDPTEYRWSGQSLDTPAPSLDLKMLQGEWKVSSIVHCSTKDIRLPEELGLNETGISFKIQGNQITVENAIAATISNDVQGADLSSKVGFLGSRVMILSTADGRAFVCSYFIENNICEIAYPVTTSCHRGSGHILRLAQVDDVLSKE